MMMSRVKSAILSAGALGIFAALPSSEMALAYADENTFLADMEAAGYSNSIGNGAEISVGFHICEEVAGGMSPLQAAEQLWRNSHLDQYGAGEFVGIALRDLCPENASSDVT